MKIEVMVDIETLDVRPNGVVLSAAVVGFNQDGIFPGSRTYARLSIDEQLALGRTVSGDTLSWWMRQEKAARFEAFHEERARLEHGLFAIGEALRNGDRIWAKGPQFDLVMLETLYRDYGWPVPWFYRVARDVRTVAEVLPATWEPDPEIIEKHCAGLVAHHPIYDCVWQIEAVRAARSMLDMA